MARQVDKYDREEFYSELSIKKNTEDAIAAKDFKKWKLIKEMYLASCLETLREEQGDVDWKRDPELSGIVAEVVRDAQAYFNRPVLVKHCKTGSTEVLNIMDDINGLRKLLGFQ